MNNQVCILLFHLSTGDNFTVYAMVLYFQKIYEKVVIFSLHRNIEMITQLYENFNNIEIVKIQDEKYNSCKVPDNYIDMYKIKYQNSNIIKTGCHGNMTYTREFYITFYEQANIDYNIRYEYNTINRNYEKENELYNKFLKKYNGQYIFVHDHRNLFYQHPGPRENVYVNSDIQIFHPNINYYIDEPDNKYFNNWNEELYSTNILDYCTIIENASEIYLSDSSFSCLCPYLKLKANIKIIYSNLNYKLYHNAFNDWKIFTR